MSPHAEALLRRSAERLPLGIDPLLEPLHEIAAEVVSLSSALAMQPCAPLRESVGVWLARYKSFAPRSIAERIPR